MFIPFLATVCQTNSSTQANLKINSKQFRKKILIVA